MKRPLQESTEGDARKRRREGEEAMMEDEEDDVMKEDEADEEEDAMKEDERQVEEEFRLDEDLLFEVFKHMDARTLGTAACVSRQWHRTAMDERLWEIICNRHWANTGCSTGQLRSVVLALGRFRRLHSLYNWPFIKPPPSSSPSSSSYSSGPLSIGRAPLSVVPPSTSARWGKDEVHLSLAPLSPLLREDESQLLPTTTSSPHWWTDPSVPKTLIPGRFELIDPHHPGKQVIGAMCKYY